VAYVIEEKKKKSLSQKPIKKAGFIEPNNGLQRIWPSA
jgi:hypothetical protein